MLCVGPAERDVLPGGAACSRPLSEGVSAELPEHFLRFHVVPIGLVHHPAVCAAHHSVDQECLVGGCAEEGEASNKQVIIPGSDYVEAVGLKICRKEPFEV